MHRRRGLISLVLLAGSMAALPGCYHMMGRAKIEILKQWKHPAADIERLDVQTHNGAIVVRGLEAADQIKVDVKIKVAAADEESAVACMEAVEPVIEADDEGTLHIGWRWKSEKQRGWSASVAFEIDAPNNVTIAAETHNGAVTVQDTTSATRLTTHNGAITITSTGGPIEAETRNGRIDASLSTDQVRLVSHNGGIKVDATGCDALGGRIETHNGAINVDLGEQTQADLKCATHNGKITHPKQDPPATAPAPNLEIETHNGAIRVSRPAK